MVIDTEKPTPTVADFKAWCQDVKSLALACCEARAFAQCKREQVDAYIKPVFDMFTFPTAPRFVEEYGPTIKREKDIYLCDDDDLCKEYYAECDAEHRKHGFKGKAGNCPALEAENLLIIAENHLLDMGAEFFGLPNRPTRMDHRAKMLDLILGACLATKGTPS